jgi:ParB family transcriptional regulator, chromosome partitioning protein
MSRNALGKGLGALIRETEAAPQQFPQQVPQETAEQAPERAVQLTSQEGTHPQAARPTAQQTGTQGRQTPRQQPQGPREGLRANPAGAGATQPGAATAVAMAPTAVTSAASQTGAPSQIDIDLIDPNPYQPRTHFDEQALEELAQSIRSTGIIQPLVLRRNGARYQLIAGERRWRAGQRAGLHKVPAILMDVPEEQALEITLVENIQRENLNPVEEAHAYDRLMSEFLMTHEEVALRTGKDRSTISNAVRLLKLEHGILNFIEEGKLSAGHARALLQVEDGIKRFAIASRAVRRGMTVRQVERLSMRIAGGQKRRQIPAPPEIDANTREAMEELSRHLGTRVGLKPRNKMKAGAIIIEYYDDAQLADIYDKILH